MQEKSRNKLYRTGFMFAIMSIHVLGISFGMELIMKEYEIEDPANIAPEILWILAAVLLLSSIIIHKITKDSKRNGDED